MPSLNYYPFRPIDSETPSFNSTSGPATSYALEATGTREWQHPSSRTVRVTSFGTDDYYIAFGVSTSTAATGTSMGVLGGVSEVFTVQPHQTHIMIHSSTDVVVNGTLGTGY